MDYPSVLAVYVQILQNCKYRDARDAHLAKRADNRAVCQNPAKKDLVLRLYRIYPSTNGYGHQRISNSNILTVQK